MARKPTKPASSLDFPQTKPTTASRKRPAKGAPAGQAKAKKVKSTQVLNFDLELEEEELVNGSMQDFTAKFAAEKAKRAHKSAEHLSSFRNQITTLETEALSSLQASHTALTDKKAKNARTLKKIQQRIGGLSVLEDEWAVRKNAFDEVVRAVKGLSRALKGAVGRDEVRGGCLQGKEGGGVREVVVGIYEKKMGELGGVLKKGRKDAVAVEKRVGRLMRGVCVESEDEED